MRASLPTAPPPHKEHAYAWDKRAHARSRGVVARRLQVLLCLESTVLLTRTGWPQWNHAIPYDALQTGLLYVILVMFCCLAGYDGETYHGSDRRPRLSDTDEGLRKSIVILEESVKSRDRLIIHKR